MNLGLGKKNHSFKKNSTTCLEFSKLPGNIIGYLNSVNSQSHGTETKWNLEPFPLPPRPAGHSTSQQYDLGSEQPLPPWWATGDSFNISLCISATNGPCTQIYPKQRESNLIWKTSLMSTLAKWSYITLCSCLVSLIPTVIDVTLVTYFIIHVKDFIYVSHVILYLWLG